MNYYTSTIPISLAEKLKKKGMPMIPCFNVTQTNSFSDDDGIHFYYLPTFGACFDWLIEKGPSCEITRFTDFANEKVCTEWVWVIEEIGLIKDIIGDYANSWHEAANAAIEKALTLI